jgi:hypothetical protein
MLLRYAGVTWHSFVVFHLLSVRVHQACVALANTWWNINKKSDWWSNLPYFSKGYLKWISWIDNIGPPIVFTTVCGVVNEIWGHGPTSLKHVSLWCFVHWSSPNHTPIKYKCPIKKSNWLTHAYLRLIYLQTSKILSQRAGDYSLWLWQQLNSLHLT